MAFLEARIKQRAVIEFLAVENGKSIDIHRGLLWVYSSVPQFYISGSFNKVSP